MKERIRKYEKEAFNKIIELLTCYDDVNPYSLYATNFFIRSNFSECLVCENENSEIIGTIFGLSKAKQNKLTLTHFYKFHIYMIYVDKSIVNSDVIYKELISRFLSLITDLKFENNKTISEINATIPHNEYYDPFLLQNLKDNGFFVYEKIIRYYPNGLTALRMKKIVSYPDELQIK